MMKRMRVEREIVRDRERDRERAKSASVLSVAFRQNETNSKCEVNEVGCDGGDSCRIGCGCCGGRVVRAGG